MVEDQQFKDTGQLSQAFRLRPPIARRVSTTLLRSFLWLLLLCLVVIGAALVRLSFGPVTAPVLAEPIAKALSDRLSPGWSAKIAQTGITLSRYGPALIAEQVEIHRPDGSLFLQARAGEISISPLQLLYGNVSVASVSFSGLDLRLTMMPDGSIQTGDDTQPPFLPTDNASETPIHFDEAVLGAANVLSDQTGLTRSLDSVSISQSRLTLVDIHGRVRATFNDVTANLAKISADERSLSLSMQGSGHPWSINGQMKGSRGQERSIALKLSQAPLTDLLMLSGTQKAPVTGNVEFSSELSVTISSDDKLTGLKGTVEGSRGTLLYEDKDQPPLDLTALRLEFERDNATGALIIPSLVLHISDARFALKGQVSFPSPSNIWHLQLESHEIYLPPLSASEAPVAIDTLSMAFRGMSGGGVHIERVAVAGAGFGIELNGELGGKGREGSVRLGIQAAPSNVRAVLRFWPAFVTPELRHYLIDNLYEGAAEKLNIAINLTMEQLEASRRKEPLPADTIRVQFSATGVKLQAAPGFPALENASVSGIVSGNNATITVPTAIAYVAKGEAITLSEGRLKLPRLTAPINASIDFRIKSTATTLARLLQREALRSMFNFDINPNALKGETDLKISLALPLIKDLRADQIVARASGRLSQLSLALDKGKEQLTNGDLELKLDTKNLTLTGNGKLDGLQAAILLKQPLHKSGKPAEADVTFILDEAARSKLGFNPGKRLSGPVTVKVSTELGIGEKEKNAPMRVDIDLARARIDHLLPGWVKAAGKPGRLTFSVVDDNGYTLSDIVLDAGVSARGSASFTPQGSLRNANLTAVKLSPNDDFALDVEHNDGIYRLSARGNLLDARPFLRLIKDGSASQMGGDSGSNLNLDLAVAVNILAGFNGEAMSKASLSLALRASNLQSLNLSGSFSGAALNANMAENDHERLVIRSENAGATLRFADIYSYMSDGVMLMHVALPAGGTGQVMIRNFVIRNEPTMERILTESPKKFAVDPGNVPFTKLKVSFSHTPGRINIQEGVLWGPGVGVTIEGNFDTRNEQIDLSGTYVPAYALNNIFSQIPIIGMLLGGGQNEGLFAINFRAQGPFNNPSLTINPLSAIAPGIFRKFFEIGRADSGQ